MRLSRGLGAIVLWLAAAPLNAQGQRWVIPPRIVGFGGAPSALLPVSPPPPYHVANGVVDSSGNLRFYVIASQSSGIDVYDAAGALIGTLQGNGSNMSHQIALVPLSGQCSRYYVLYFSSKGFTGVDFRAAVVDVDKKLIVSNATLATYNDNRGALAVGRLRSDGSRFLYAIASTDVRKFIIDANGITLDSTLVSSNPPSNLAFYSTQAVLSSDGSRLAWNDGLQDLVWVASLDAAGDLASSPPLRSFASGPTAGVAFSPDGTRLFFSTAHPSAGPISMIDLSASPPAIVPLAALSAAYAGSLLQLASDGRIYAAGPTNLGAIDPAISSFTPTVFTGIVTGTPINGVRTLPYQINGEPQLACDALCGNPALIQGSFGNQGNFELVVPFAGHGMAHYWRDNDASGLVWYGPIVFGMNNGTVNAVSLIQSTFGGGKHLEVVARVGDQLMHFWRDTSVQWHGPTAVFASGASGTPSFIQGNSGIPGDFELVTPLASGGMAHYSRDNATFQWSAPAPFGASIGVVSDVSLIQSTFGGHLEVVAHAGGQLLHFWRDPSFVWHGPTAILASGIVGAPSLIQGRFGVPGNFEVVAPGVGGGMSHYWRNNQTLAWSAPTPFGGGNVRSVSLIQSNYGDNFEVAARVDCCLVHYWRDSFPSIVWSQPTPIDSCITTP